MEDKRTQAPPLLFKRANIKQGGTLLEPKKRTRPINESYMKRKKELFALSTPDL